MNIKTMSIFKKISYQGDWFELTFYVNNDNTISNSKMMWFTYHIDDKINIEWSSNEYFSNLDKTKIKDLKDELKQLNIYQKGMIKEIKALLNQAKTDNLL